MDEICQLFYFSLINIAQVDYFLTCTVHKSINARPTFWPSLLTFQTLLQTTIQAPQQLINQQLAFMKRSPITLLRFSHFLGLTAINEMATANAKRAVEVNGYFCSTSVALM
jgi:hypothetical protein